MAGGCDAEGFPCSAREDPGRYAVIRNGDESKIQIKK